MADDDESMNRWRRRWWWLILLLVVILYLVFNIVGSVYYSMLDKVDPGVEGICLTTVILGWLGSFWLNLTSPIVYSKY